MDERSLILNAIKNRKKNTQRQESFKKLRIMISVNPLPRFIVSCMYWNRVISFPKCLTSLLKKSTIFFGP